MNEDMKTKLLDKIKKLLALSTSPNENEAAAAAEKAQSLLAEHNLSMADIKITDAKSDVDEVEVQGGIYTSAHPWRRPLASAIAQMYFCKYMYYPRQSKNEHLFIGARHNIAVATAMFLYLIKAIDRMAQEGSRSVSDREKSPYRVAFRASCTLRLCRRIHDRILAAKRGEVKAESGRNLPALLSLYERANAANQAFMDKTYSKMKTSKSVMRTNLHQRGASEGYAAGNKIGLDQQVGNQSHKMIG